MVNSLHLIIYRLRSLRIMYCLHRGGYVPSDKSPRHSLDMDDGTSDRVEHSPAHSSEPSTPATPTPNLTTTLGEDKLLAPPPPDDTSPYFTENW